MQNKRFVSSIGFVDLLFNLLIGFVFLFVLAFILINPPTKKDDTEEKAEYLIIMSWPDGDKNDIDTWTKCATSGFVSFRKKDNGHMHLDRDDRGQQNDKVNINGIVTESVLNREVTSLRSKLPCKYIVNIHLYNRKDQKTTPVPIHVELVQINPYKVVATTDMNLVLTGQEQTAFQFEINEEGNLVNLNRDQKTFISSSAAGAVPPHPDQRGMQ